MSKTEVAKVTAKSIIIAGIEAGRKTEVIISNVLKKIPDSKADAAHVKHYAGILCRAGELEADVAEAKYGYIYRGAAPLKPAKKAKKATVETDEVPVKKARRKVAAPVEEVEEVVVPKKSAAVKSKGATKRKTV